MGASGNRATRAAPLDIADTFSRPDWMCGIATLGGSTATPDDACDQVLHTLRAPPL